MNTSTVKTGVLAATVVVLICAQAGLGLIVVGGSDPMRDCGWPEGTLAVANLPTRVNWWEGPPFGGGMYVFQYQCKTTAEFNNALKVFAAITSDRHELIVHNGPRNLAFADEREIIRMDWSFTAWVPQNWNNLYNNKSLFMADHPDYGKPVPAPWIDLYVGGGPIVWDDIVVPKNITVTEKRPGAIDKAFAGKGLIRCRVFDLDTNKPLPGAEVVVAESTRDVNPKPPLVAVTDDNGSCQIAQIPLARYTVCVRSRGYASRSVGDYDNAIAELYEFQTRLTRTGALSGIVVDTQEKPIFNATVSVRTTLAADGSGYPCPGPHECVTDDNGVFRIDSLPIGSAQLRCRAGTMHLKDSIFEVYTVPSEGIRLVMEKTSIVRGKVYAKDWQTPTGNIHVTIRQVGEEVAGTWGGSMRVQADGTFEFKGVPPGDYLVGIGGMIRTEEDKKKATLVSVRPDTVYEVELVQSDEKQR